MKNLISISTGFAHRLTPDKNEMIQIIKSFQPDGIELILPDPPQLFNFKLSQENVDYLKSLKFSTIHSPSNIEFGQNTDSTKTLDMIADIYRQIDAKNVVVHPLQVSDYSVFDHKKMHFSLENEDYRKSNYQTPDEFFPLFDRYPSFGFNFDFAHALTIDSKYIPYFLKIKNLFEIHLAFHDRAENHHSLLFEKADDKTIDLLKLIPENTPLVLECYVKSWSEIDKIKEEISFLKSI